MQILKILNSFPALIWGFKASLYNKILKIEIRKTKCVIKDKILQVRYIKLLGSNFKYKI